MLGRSHCADWEDIVTVLESVHKFLALRAEIAQLEEHADAHDREEFVHCEICDELLREKQREYSHMALDCAPTWALEIAEHQCQLPQSIQEALNSGDGVYRP